MSLGTSDTVLMWLEQPKVSLDGAALVNPLDTDHYMGLLWWVCVTSHYLNIWAGVVSPNAEAFIGPVHIPH